jgi:hypothetical protein
VEQGFPRLSRSSVLLAAVIIIQDQFTFFTGNGAIVCAGHLFAYPIDITQGAYNFELLTFGRERLFM